MCMKTFTEKTKEIVKNISRGEVMTYKEVAALAGNPKAARAVANTMAHNFDPTIPCHRVIRSDGNVGGYNRGGAEKKHAILKSEGVILK